MEKTDVYAFTRQFRDMTEQNLDILEDRINVLENHIIELNKIIETDVNNMDKILVLIRQLNNRF